MISVIIPVLNEADNLRRLLPALKGALCAYECLVVDGGSTDGSADVARALGAQVVSSERGRGQQLRAGAEAASGAILFFLHADSVIDRYGLAAIDCEMERRPDAVGGNFRLVFEGTSAFCAELTRFYAWMRRRGWYYGDSGIFVRRGFYDRLGGIKPISLMEDYDFVCRMEAVGLTLCIEDPPLVTSGRRFEGRSRPNIIWGWIRIHALYALGLAPRRLARIYNNLR